MRLLGSILLVALATMNLYAQPSADTKNTLIHYMFSMSEDVLNSLDPYEAITSKEKSIVKRFTDQLDRDLTIQTYDVFTKALKEKAKLELAPTATMQGAVMYNDAGFPYPMIPKKAVKKHGKGNGDYFFNLRVNMTKPPIGGGFIGVKPSVSIKLVVFDLSGAKVHEIKASAKTEKGIRSVDFEGKKFDKMDDFYVAPLIEKLMPTIEDAVLATIAQL